MYLRFFLLRIRLLWNFIVFGFSLSYLFVFFYVNSIEKLKFLSLFFVIYLLLLLLRYR